MEPTNTENTEKDEKIPFMQKLLDDPFMLLFIGLNVPTFFYTIWGVIEVANIPFAP